MTASQRNALLPLLFAGLEVPALAIALKAHAQSQEVTPTAADSCTNPPAEPINLQALGGARSGRPHLDSLNGPDGRPLRHPAPQPGHGRIAGLPRYR